MKISPVQGTPTIQQPANTGFSPDKKAAALSKLLGTAAQEQQNNVGAVTDGTKPPAIKMTTNRNPEAIDAAQEAAPSPESAILDTSVQTKPEPEAIQQVSPQIAALAKEKRALQVKERELADKQKEIDAKLAPYLEREERIKNGQALSVLQKDYGVTYDQLTEEILGKQSQPDFKTFKDDLLKSIDEKLAGKDAAQEQAVFEHMSKNVNKLTFSSDEYPFIKTGKAQGKVMELIKRTWQEQGEVLDEEEAMGLIEAELKEEARAYAKLLKEPGETTPAAAEPQQKQQAPTAPIKTLTNKDSARPAMSRRQRAIAAALGQHK